MSWKTLTQVALRANVPALVWGKPGIGKTSYVYQLAASLGLPLEVVIASIREPSDFLGLPVRDGAVVHMAPPSWAKRLADAGQGIVLFDEISTAPPAVQAALLRVVFERVVGDLALPAGVRILAVANPADMVNGWELSLPLNNRFFHIETEDPEPTTWAQGMIAKRWADPLLTLTRTNDGYGLIAGFIKYRPQLLMRLPDDKAKDQRSWPSPRSWENAAKLLGAAGEQLDELSVPLLTGVVGQGPAREFAKWLQELDLPDPLEVLAEGQDFRFKGRRLDQVFAILSATNHATREAMVNANGEAEQVWLRGWGPLVAASEAKMPDVAATAAVALAQMREAGWKLPQDKRSRDFTGKHLAQMLDVQ